MSMWDLEEPAKITLTRLEVVLFMLGTCDNIIYCMLTNILWSTYDAACDIYAPTSPEREWFNTINGLIIPATVVEMCIYGIYLI